MCLPLKTPVPFQHGHNSLMSTFGREALELLTLLIPSFAMCLWVSSVSSAFPGAFHHIHADLIFLPSPTLPLYIHSLFHQFISPVSISFYLMSSLAYSPSLLPFLLGQPKLLGVWFVCLSLIPSPSILTLGEDVTSKGLGERYGLCFVKAHKQAKKSI